MEYLLKVSALVAVFYLIYKLLLQRDTFFEANRGFLLLGLATSFLLPLWTISVYHKYTPQVIPVNTIETFQEVVVATPIAVEESFDIMEILLFVYGVGVVVFLGFFCYRLFSLLKAITNSKSIKKGEYTFIETAQEISPFSFFKWIVYNPNQFKDTELAQIIAHEKIHVQQYHSIDILFTELCCSFLWFHPLVWLYNKSLKQNLEFLADKYALNQFENRKSYQYTLLKASIPVAKMALSNHFYNSLIKKRIAMIQKSKSKKINLLKYALVVPVLTFFLMSFNTKDVYVEKRMYSNDDKIVIDKNTSNIEFKKITKKFKEDYNIGVAYKGIKRNFKKEISYITVELLLSDSLTFSKTQKSINNIESIEPFVISYNHLMKTIDVRDLKDEKKKELSIIVNKNTTDRQLKEYKEFLNKKFDINILYDNIKRNENNELISINMDLFDKRGKISTYQDGTEAIKSFIVEYNPDIQEMKTYMIKNYDTGSGNVVIKQY